MRLTKIGVNTAENEPDEVPIIFVLLMMSPGVPRVVVGAAVMAAEHVHVVPHGVPGLGALVQVLLRDRALGADHLSGHFLAWSTQEGRRAHT